jgi:hypothetical protein
LPLDGLNVNRSSIAVLRQSWLLSNARDLFFPFPVLGLDTDNGGEFINEKMVAYCEGEHITFTRGRPQLKNDQCFVEQKNGTVVRQIVGYGRLVGLPVYQQLAELYHALRLYINFFQPSLKLVAKQRDGKKVRHIYDSAKTPLQRVLLCEVVSSQKQQELNEMAQVLDPLRLFQQLERLQQAVFRCALDDSPSSVYAPSPPILLFALADCTIGSLFVEERIIEPTVALLKMREQRHRQQCMDWRSTKNDPFTGVWEQIASWVIAHPERSVGEIFRDLQRLYPGRYQPGQFRTLQRGVVKIRTHLLEIKNKYEWKW